MGYSLPELFLYKNIVVILIKSGWQHRVLWFSLSHPSLLVRLLDCIQCPHKADVCKSFLVGQHWHIHVYESIRERSLWFRPKFSSNAWPVLCVLFSWFVRWQVSGRTAAVLLGVASSSKQHVTFSSNSHLIFSPDISLASRWCICTVVLIQPQLGRNVVLFYQRHQISIWSITKVYFDVTFSR